MFSIEALFSERRNSPFRFRPGFERRATICLMFISPSGIWCRCSLASAISPRLSSTPPPHRPKPVT